MAIKLLVPGYFLASSYTFLQFQFKEGEHGKQGSHCLQPLSRKKNMSGCNG